MITLSEPPLLQSILEKVGLVWSLGTLRNTVIFDDRGQIFIFDIQNMHVSFL